MADDLGREAIPGVAGASGCRHPTRLLTPACRRKRGKARQLDGAVVGTLSDGHRWDPPPKVVRTRLLSGGSGFELPVTASSVKSPSAPPRTVGANRRSGIGAIGRARLPAARFIPRMRIAWHLDAQTVNGRMGAAQQCA
jgi:hypothetical protein